MSEEGDFSLYNIQLMEVRSRVNVPNVSLSTFLAALMAGLFAVFGSVSMWLGTRAASRELQQKVGEGLQHLAYEMTDKLDQGMFERARDIDILSELEGFRNYRGSQEQQRLLLDKLKSTFPSYAWIGLANPQGKVLVSTGGLLEGQNVAARPWFQGALKGSFAGDVHEAKLLAKLLPREGTEPLRFVDVATPVRDRNGHVVGVLGAHLSWSWAREVRESLLQPVQEREHLDVFILDRSGTVLLGPPAWQGQSLQLDVLGRSPVSGYSVTRWPDGQMYVTGISRSRGYRSYSGLEWRVVIRQDTRVAFAGITTFQRTSLLTSLGLSVLFALVGLILAHLIARPLMRLRQAAQAIEVGDLNAEVPQVRAYAEVSTLAQSLRQLVGSLKENERELERRIAERTHTLESRTKEAEALAALSVLSTESLPLADLTQALAPIIAQACELDWVGCVALRGEQGRVTTLFRQGEHPPLPESLQNEIATRGLIHTALELNRALYVDNYAAQVQALPTLVEWGVRSAVFIPLPAAQAHRQTLVAARCEERPWTEDDRQVLEAALRIVQISEERRSYLLDLEFAALHDRLTGLGNRRAFDLNLDQTISAAQRHGETFGLMMIDLDGLKTVNDMKGHERGDDLLREFAAALRTAFRHEDRIFRLGGDEYAVILERASSMNPRVVLDRVSTAVSLTRQAGHGGMDASAGVAFFPEDAPNGPVLTRLADERMYTEKRNHRALQAQKEPTIAAEGT